MRCIGLLGSENSDFTAAYAKLIREEVHHRFGHSHACNLIALSLHTDETMHTSGKDSEKATHDILKTGTTALRSLGAEAIVPCSSRLQVAAENLTLEVPLIGMHDALGRALQTLKVRRVGLIGAGSEAEERLWRKSLARYHVLDLFVPMHRDREHLAHVAAEELQQGIVNQTTRADMGRIVYSLRQAGARAIVLATPALGLALSHLDPVLPMLDALELHALAALEWSLNPPFPTQSSPARKLRR